RPCILLRQRVLRHVAYDLDAGVLRGAPQHLRVEGAVADQRQPRARVVDEGEGVEQVRETLALLELPYEQDRPGATDVASGRKPRAFDGLTRSEDLRIVHAANLVQRTADVVSVNDDRVGPAVQRLGWSLRQPVEDRLRVLPRTRPQDERQPPSARGREDVRQHDATRETHDNGVVPRPREPSREAWKHRLAQYRQALEADLAEVALLERRQQRIPVRLGGREEEAVELEPTGQQLEERSTVVGAEVLDQRDAALRALAAAGGVQPPPRICARGLQRAVT